MNILWTKSRINEEEWETWILLRFQCISTCTDSIIPWMSSGFVCVPTGRDSEHREEVSFRRLWMKLVFCSVIYGLPFTHCAFDFCYSRMLRRAGQRNRQQLRISYSERFFLLLKFFSVNALHCILKKNCIDLSANSVHWFLVMTTNLMFAIEKVCIIERKQLCLSPNAKIENSSMNGNDMGNWRWEQKISSERLIFWPFHYICRKYKKKAFNACHTHTT